MWRPFLLKHCIGLDILITKIKILLKLKMTKDFLILKNELADSVGHPGFHQSVEESISPGK